MRPKPRGYRNCWACKARSANSIARSPIASRRVRWICRRPGLLIICGRPRWTSSRSISRIMRRIRESWRAKVASAVMPGWSEGPDLRCAIAHRGISRFRVRCFASPRNDVSLLPHPFRRTLFRKCLRPFDVILRRRHRLHRGILALFGDRLLQRHREALLNGLLAGADRHRAVLADRLRPALSGCQRFAGWNHLIHKTEFVAFLCGDMARGEDHAHRALQPDLAR